MAQQILSLLRLLRQVLRPAIILAVLLGTTACSGLSGNTPDPGDDAVDVTSASPIETDSGKESTDTPLPMEEVMTGITLAPYTGKGFTGVAPSGWTEKNPGEFSRGESPSDPTFLVQQEVPGATSDLVMGLLAPKLGLETAPESVGGITNASLSWELFSGEGARPDVGTTKLDIALAEANGRVYLVLMGTRPDEYADLHYGGFLRVVDTLTPAAAAAGERHAGASETAVEDFTAQVLLIKGEQLENDASEAVARLLNAELGFSTAFVDLDALDKVDYQDVKLIYFPGGDCASIRISATAARRVREAVAAGTGYIGTCCGAFLAAEATAAASHIRLAGDGFGAFPGLAEWGGGEGTWPFFVDTDNPIVSNSSFADRISPKMRMRFVGGTSNLQPSYAEGLQNWMVATLENPLERTSGGRRAVMTATLYGKGRVFLTGAHPEAQGTTQSLVLAAAEWCTGVSEPQDGPPPVIVSEIPAEGIAGRFFAVSAVGSRDPHGYPIGFIWDFGDGSPKQYRPEAIHIFERPGTFSVVLTVTTGNRNSTQTAEITIREP
jgi:glutamine amidotransferase-like uncharacterized protein